MQLTPTPPLVVMSFNLRFANDDSPNSWKDRRPVMKNCIQKISPDLIGTQEGLYFQIQHIVKDLQDYEWIGLGRKGGAIRVHGSILSQGTIKTFRVRSFLAFRYARCHWFSNMG